MPFEVLTKKEAAERARISRTMLDKQIRLGIGPAVTQIGGCTRIRSDLFEEWLRNRTVQPAGDQAAA